MNHEPPKSGIPKRKKTEACPRLSCKIEYLLTSNHSDQSTTSEYFTDDQLAARMLQTTRDAVLQVASEVGYDSEAAFNRAFKREFGQPPGRYRSDHKSSATRKAGGPLTPGALA